MRLKDFEESNSFFTKFEKKTRNELKSSGANLSEREKLDYVLKTLPESLSYIGDLIDSLKESDRTCEFVKKKITIWETRNQRESDKKRSNVFKVEKKRHKVPWLWKIRPRGKILHKYVQRRKQWRSAMARRCVSAAAE